MGQVSNFKGFDDWVEVFRTGTHTDSKGVTHTFGTEHLDQMVLNTAPDTAPMVVGHPKMDAPAYGWAQQFKRSGDVLLAINGTSVKNMDQVRAALDKSGKSVALLIERDGNRIFVPVNMG